MKVFISCSHQDIEIKNILEHHLSASEHLPISCDLIDLGEEVCYTISKMLNEADAFVFIISEHSLSSKWQVWEWRNALERSWASADKPLLCILVGNITSPSYLDGYQYLKINSNEEVSLIIPKVMELLNPSEKLPDAEDAQAGYLLEKMNGLSTEISKFKLNQDDLAVQIRWLVERIEHIERLMPESAEIENLQSKLAKIFKILGKGKYLLPAKGSSSAIIEREGVNSLPQHAQIQHVLENVLNGLGDNRNGLRQLCRALERAGFVVEMHQVRELMQTCTEYIPLVASAYSRLLDNVDSAIDTFAESNNDLCKTKTGGEP